MKIVKYAIVLFAIVCFVSARVSLRPVMYTVTMKVTDSLSVDESEVTVMAWLSYYSWLVNNENDYVSQHAIPDSTAMLPEVWKLIANKANKMNDSLSLFTYQPIGFFNSQKYESINPASAIPYSTLLELPMTGLSYEQVQYFCEWRTEMVGNKKLEYRLPTEKEWTKIAKLSLTKDEQKYGLKDSIDRQNKQTFYYNSNTGNKQPALQVTESLPEDNLHCFDLFGNVAEMTATKGIAKGGSFMHRAASSHPDSVQHYLRPQKWLGFRCVAVAIPKE